MIIGKVKYVGKSFGVEQLTDGKVYDVLKIEDQFLRIIDDSGEDYLYSISKPSSLDNPNLCGKWVIIEDKDNILTKYLDTRNLEKVIVSFLNDFDAHKINEYFANDFSDDWDIYLDNGTSIDILEYLNDSFYNIDIDYRDTDLFNDKVKEILNKALELLNEKKR